jgi:hypothetical protein
MLTLYKPNLTAHQLLLFIRSWNSNPNKVDAATGRRFYINHQARQVLHCGRLPNPNLNPNVGSLLIFNFFLAQKRHAISNCVSVMFTGNSIFLPDTVGAPRLCSGPGSVSITASSSVETPSSWMGRAD